MLPSPQRKSGPARYLIAGCGYVGTALGHALVQRGDEVWALRRDTKGLPAAFHGISADLNDRDALAALPPTLDYVVFAASAGESSDAAYERTYVSALRSLVSALERRSVQRLFFISSTAVYAQQDGEWVDETSETAPTHFSGRRTLEAEALLRAGPLPATALRCAGIYGPGRTRLIDSVRSGTARGSLRFTNRIHRDDIAGAIVHLVERGTAAPVLILSDDDPAPQHDVLRYLARKLGVAEPSAAEGVDADGRGGNKRCRNARLLATGYQLLYPTYRQGYDAMLGELAPTGAAPRPGRSDPSKP
jgi:nucleoside-diphosphate-sugar epimerase